MEIIHMIDILMSTLNLRRLSKFAKCGKHVSRTPSRLSPKTIPKTCSLSSLGTSTRTSSSHSCNTSSKPTQPRKITSLKVWIRRWITLWIIPKYTIWNTTSHFKWLPTIIWLAKKFVWSSKSRGRYSEIALDLLVLMNQMSWTSQSHAWTFSSGIISRVLVKILRRLKTIRNWSNLTKSTVKFPYSITLHQRLT